MKRPEINITPIERAGRITMGGATAIVGVVLLASAGSVLAIVLETLPVLAGFDLVLTGALGYCLLYRKFGHVPTSLRRLARTTMTRGKLNRGTAITPATAG